MPKPTTDEIRFAITSARTDYGIEGKIEIEDGPKSFDVAPSQIDLSSLISACDNWREEGGFYVKAWVWVEVPR